MPGAAASSTNLYSNATDLRSDLIGMLTSRRLAAWLYRRCRAHLRNSVRPDRAGVDGGIDVIAALVFVHVVPVADVVDGGPAGRAGAAERDLVVFSAVLRGGTQELAVYE